MFQCGMERKDKLPTRSREAPREEDAVVEHCRLGGCMSPLHSSAAKRCLKFQDLTSEALVRLILLEEAALALTVVPESQLPVSKYMFLQQARMPLKAAAAELR